MHTENRVYKWLLGTLESYYAHTGTNTNIPPILATKNLDLTFEFYFFFAAVAGLAVIARAIG